MDIEDDQDEINPHPLKEQLRRAGTTSDHPEDLSEIVELSTE
ncbi:MAG: hypothetical protein Q7J45_00370 [bacterium]|nr:hypothetical protein [bacterium]